MWRKSRTTLIRPLSTSTKDVVKEAVSAYYDFPIIDKDLLSDKEFYVPNSLTHKQVVLNLDQNPLDDLLDIEIIDGLSDFCSDDNSNVISPLEQAPVDGFNHSAKLSPLRLQALPKKPEQETNLDPPTTVRRSPRLSKVVV